MHRCLGKRRALLIGSPGPRSVPERRLAGVAHDLCAMATVLEAWQFECTRLFDHQATRDGILGALRRLVDEATPAHTIVVYYVGHGGRRRVEGRELPAWNYLVPVDHAADRFRGVAEVELADILHDLGQRARDVTVILDCCHAATMVRDGVQGPAERVRAFNDVRTEVEELLVREARPIEWDRLPRELQHRLGEGGERLEARLHPESHPHAVRLVATGADSSAYEYADDGRESGHAGYRGYFTTELCRALTEARGSRCSWDTIVHRARERIFERRGTTTQRPQVEGPAARLPFSLELRDDARGHLLVSHEDRSTWVRAGRLHGLSEGDPLTLVDDHGTEVGTARVEALFDDSARLALVRRPSGRAPRGPASAAIPTQHRRRKAVWLAKGAAGVEGLVEGIEGSAWLHHAEARGGALLHVELRSGMLRASGPPGLSRRPRSCDRGDVDALVDDVEHVARAELLSALLESPPGLGKVSFELEVFAAEDSGALRSLRCGEVVRVGERLCARVRHTTDHKPPIYVNALGRGVDRRLGLISRSEPEGIEVRSGESRWIGRRSGGPPGISFTWPRDVPPAEQGRGDLIFVISRRALDLRVWCGERGQHEARVRPQRGPEGPELGERLMWTSVRFELVVKV